MSFNYLFLIKFKVLTIDINKILFHLDNWKILKLYFENLIWKVNNFEIFNTTNLLRFLSYTLCSNQLQIKVFVCTMDLPFLLRAAVLFKEAVLRITMLTPKQ